ncbi:RelA/SpoT domain-containing protein [Xanthobacter versatilis]|uniref:RelA/SpoT domain-containing protein n=1 Tax=Xanthobacter autotrophicus (strain ATCC BAA-1158 / Py2) TaxID=78245 RepID=UPI00372919D5
MISKNKIDKAGTILSDKERQYDETSLEMDYIFDEYRKDHLEPLTDLTLEIQSWLQAYDNNYYIAQRLKRKPQILRKLKRLSVRLTQLQDIGGCRIIVENNRDVDRLLSYINNRLSNTGFLKIIRSTDYRDLGRDDTGYRSYHIILDVRGYRCELQIRSRIQHYWSESIERTSVIYGFRLKEKEGDQAVIDYFKHFSNALHEIEINHGINSAFEIDLERRRKQAEQIITSTQSTALSGHVNSNIIKTMSEIERNNGQRINNWILVFDWNDGNFISWDFVSRNADEAVEKYKKYEMEYPEEEKYEVVMIGTSDISTVIHTHSHYFGIEHHNEALEGMDSSIIGISNRSKLDIGARRILYILKNRRFFGDKMISVSTLKNHFCKNVATFDASLSALRDMNFLIGYDPVSLDPKKANAIAEYV